MTRATDFCEMREPVGIFGAASRRRRWGELPPLLKRGDPVARAKTAGRFWGAGGSRRRRWGELPPTTQEGDPVARAKTAGRFWGGRRDSNPLPQPWEGRALPGELLPHAILARLDST